MQRIREWRTPRTFNDVKRFLGLVQYIAHFMPDVSAFTGPLHGMTKNGHVFEWRPIHQKCLDSIKALACKTLILKPIDPSKDEPIWVICDASTSGVGAVYGQGPDWQTCRPAGFMSKKFTTAQHSYRVFKMEMIAILEALLKWEDKLLGQKVQVVTDHQALQFFKSQRRLSNRQTRWMEFLERFDFEVTYVEGELNKVTDCLSRYYAADNWDETHAIENYVNADSRLDPQGESLPFVRTDELRAMRTKSRKQRLPEVVEDRVVEAEGMTPEKEDNPQFATVDDPTWGESTTNGPPLQPRIEAILDFKKKVRNGYELDTTLAKVMAAPNEHKLYQVRDGLLWTNNRQGISVLCVPRIKVDKRRLTKIILEQAHTALGHMGTQKTNEYIRWWYWWPTIGCDVERYCNSCGTCQTTKSSMQKPTGLLHSMPIPT